MSVTINGSSGVTTPGISNSEGYTGDGLTIAAGAPSGAVAVDSSGNVGIGTSSPGAKLELGGTNPSMYFGPVSTGSGAYLSYNTSGNYFAINAVTQGVGYRNIAIANDGGNLLVGTTSAVAKVTVYGTTGNCASFQNDSGASRFPVLFYNGATNVGNIATNTSSTSYNTSSDYRLKENIQPMTGALAKVAELKPVTYKWKADGSDGEGFIAHELQEVVPQCVTGEKDAVDAEGKPVYQGIDTSFLVATLTAAIQELKAQVDAQAVEIAALKGQA